MLLPMARPLRCMVGWHHWVKRHRENEQYEACSRCGKVSQGPWSMPDLGSGAG